ncbi:2'-5' RNA ligase family protein [Planomonospora sp. ID82291]|uniref:2'-5' RNA ligase family protein n=1 Tax=Planomonospora sp. ID82291 TaxID=2738136 RepID=UPI0018C3E514|nr:2'-5' RNA ligase family protein [Planomonospora sp. ID82291]MBG0818767.1 2'-5' RNA ligase family protein [Planomonospora sp. ID82291]
MATGWMQQLEHKAVTAAPRTAEIAVDGSGDGTVEALVAVTGVLDGVGDIIVPGAFARTLAERKPKGIFSHDTKIWTARTEVVEEWLPGDARLPSHTKDGKPWPREAGALYVRCRFNLKSDDGRNAYENVRFFSETDECEWSIGYQVPAGKARQDTKTGIRRIYDLDLYEYSPVLFGAASQSATLSVKTIISEPAPGVDVAALTASAARKLGMTSRRTAGGDTKDNSHGNARNLAAWYVRGEGAARIGWNTEGAFGRCVALASEHMTLEQAKGYCAERHHEATGRWPGARHEKKAAGVGAEWADVIPSPVPADEDGPRAMVALIVPSPVAAHLAQPDGLDATSLHVTLAYLGQGVDAETIAAAEQAVAEAAATMPPLTGSIGGLGMFPDRGDGIPVWAPVDVPGLEVARQRIIDALDATGVPYSTEHGYTPHVTLTYLQPGQEPPAPLPAVDVTFSAVTIAIEDDHRDFPLAATGVEVKDARLDVLRAAGLPIPLAFEEVRDKVRLAVTDWMAARGQRGWVCVDATFADMAIITVRGDDASTGREVAYQVPYTVTATADVVIDTPIPVQVSAYGSADPMLALAAVEDAAYTVKHATRAWADRYGTGWETKAGRVLSDNNARRLRQAMAILAEVLTSAGIDHEPIRDPEPHKQQEMPPEPAVYPDSTAPSALPDELKHLSAEQWRAGEKLLDFAAALT